MEGNRENMCQDVDFLIQRARSSFELYSSFPQEHVDAIFKAVAVEAASNRILLAEAAFNETQMGVLEDKIIKNHYAAEYTFNKYSDVKTCGFFEEDPVFGIQKVWEPVGVIASIIPTTNPTSTVIFKALLALKTRNAIIFSPHPRAQKSSIMAAEIILKAALQAGAPEGIVGWIQEPSIALSTYLMNHTGVDLILATGGNAMVSAAYHSGHPAIGVGSGNTPVIIDETADMTTAVHSIILSKTFDNGLICASEQSVIVLGSVFDEFQSLCSQSGAYILNEEEVNRLRTLLYKDPKNLIHFIGQPVQKIAKEAGIEINGSTRVLLAPVEKVGVDEPLSSEKLFPVLALYQAPDFNSCIEQAKALLTFSGMGHTAVLYSYSPENSALFAEKIKAGRLLLNQPAAHGAIGDLFNFHVDPALTLGCGTWGGNSMSENLTLKHLMNVKTVAKRRENMLWFRVPPKIYFKYGCLEGALQELKGHRKAQIITDAPLFEQGYTRRLTSVLESFGMACDIIHDVDPDPTTQTVERLLKAVRSFEPDVLIAFGGGSSIDAAKIVRLFYEVPEESFHELSLRFMDIRKRICKIPLLGKKSILVCIPTTSGTGAEVTPFAVIRDETGVKYPLADYALTPDMAIVDSSFCLSLPKTLVAHTGIDALTHALEAYVSILATEYTDGLALEAARLIFNNLISSYEKGDHLSREAMHHAATLSGMAFANAFLGVCHSMAHKLGAAFHLSHGLSNALLISHVILYNASPIPTKQAAFSQYTHPIADERYARFAAYVGMGGQTPSEAVRKLVEGIEVLKKRIGIPPSIQACGVDEDHFMRDLDHLSLLAYDDQCTSTNPRAPLISEIKDIYIRAYYGRL